jgi:Fe2+ or Zn2+ uptake regulation protein
MVVSGVDMANPDSAEALFGEMGFDSPTMLILTVFQLLGSFLAFGLLRNLLIVNL